MPDSLFDEHPTGGRPQWWHDSPHREEGLNQHRFGLDSPHRIRIFFDVLRQGGIRIREVELTHKNNRYLLGPKGFYTFKGRKIVGRRIPIEHIDADRAKKLMEIAHEALELQPIPSSKSYYLDMNVEGRAHLFGFISALDSHEWETGSEDHVSLKLPHYYRKFLPEDPDPSINPDEMRTLKVIRQEGKITALEMYHLGMNTHFSYDVQNDRLTYRTNLKYGQKGSADPRKPYFWLFVDALHTIAQHKAADVRLKKPLAEIVATLTTRGENMLNPNMPKK